MLSAFLILLHAPQIAPEGGAADTKLAGSGGAVAVVGC